MPKPTTTTLIFLWFFFLLTHNIFNYFSLYWAYPGVDIPMHLFGGGLILISLYKLQDNKTLNTFFAKSHLHVLVLLFIATLIWEIYQVLSGKRIDETYLSSTVSDIFFGMVGGTAVFLWLNFKNKTK